jgi:hypothetical protein
MWVLFWILKHLDSLYYISAILGIIGVFMTIASGIKQRHFNTVSKCFETYRNDFIWLNENDRIGCDKYIDFVGEEVFYIKSGFIPKRIALEWIYGMIDNMPIFFEDCNKERVVLHSSFLEKHIEKHEMLNEVFVTKKELPNIKKILLKNHLERSGEENKVVKKLIGEIYCNIKVYQKNCLCRLWWALHKR